MTPKERLIRARERINKGWVQNLYAVRTVESAPAPHSSMSVTSDSPDAVAWCLLGALGADVEPTRTVEQFVMDCIREVSPPNAFWSIPEWNDKMGRTKDEVISVIDCAIVKADAPDADA